MPRWSPIQNAFNGGELSPILDGRTDIAKYTSGASTILNWWIQPQGGVHRRSGTRFVLEVKDSSKATRLVPFVFSTTQAYIIEFGENYCRFYRNEGNIESAGSPYEVVTTYTESELFELQFAQSADVLYITHKDHHPAKLSRTGHTSWTLEDFDFLDGPWLDVNTSATTMTVSAVTGNNITITASAPTFDTTRDVGRILGMLTGGGTAWGSAKLKADGANSTTVFKADVQEGFDFGGLGPNTEWKLGAWYVNNWPTTVSFFEQRLAFAGEVDTPQALSASMSGNYETFSPIDSAGSVEADNGFRYTIGSNQVNAIRWILVRRALMLGTSSSIFPVQASTQNEAVTPTNINVPASTANGTSDVQAIRVENSIIYASRAKRRILGMSYSFEADDFKSSDLTMLARHITGSGIVELDYAQEPDNTVLVVTSDGELGSMAFVPEQEVFSWSRQRIGGTFGTGNAVIESVAVIPSPNEDHDQIWVIVKRTIDGSTARYVEFFEENFRSIDDEQDIDDAFFVDSGLTYDGAATTTIGGLDHLEGETVQVLADGAPVPDEVVASGAITLATAASTVQAGLGFNSDLQTLRLDPPDPEGSAQGKQHRVDHVVVRFDNTIGCSIGPDSSNLDAIQFREADDPMDAAPPIFTGDKKESIDMGWTDNPRIFIRQSQPLPATILSLTYTGQGGAR